MKRVLDIHASTPVERLVASPDGRIAVQDESSISFLDVASGRLHPVVPERLGRELVAVVAPARVVVFHEDEGLVALSADGQSDAKATLTPDVEFVAARTLPNGQAAVVLLAEMVGPPLELGVPRFRFVLAHADLSIVSIKANWPQCPRAWAVDDRAQRLLVQAEPGGAVLTEFGLRSGKAAGESRWGPKPPDERVLTGLDLSPTDSRGIAGLADEEAQTAQLCIVEQGGADPTVLATLRDGGFVENPRWSPDGKRVLFRYGPDDKSVWMVADVAAQARRSQPRAIPDADADADAIWIGPTRAAVVVAESNIRIMDLV